MAAGEDRKLSDASIAERTLAASLGSDIFYGAVSGGDPFRYQRKTLSFYKAENVPSTNFTPTDIDNIYQINVTTGASDRTITLPTHSANKGRSFIISKVDSGAGKVIVDGEGAETIHGDLTFNIENQRNAIMIYANDTEWEIMGYNAPLWSINSDWRALLNITSSVSIATPYTTGTFRQFGLLSLTVPAGTWDAFQFYEVNFRHDNGTNQILRTTLSTTTTTETDNDLTIRYDWPNFGTQAILSGIQPHVKRIRKVLASPTTYNVVGNFQFDGTFSNYNIRGDVSDPNVVEFRRLF